MWVLDSKMGLLKMERGYFRCFFLCLMIRLAAGNVVLIGKNVSLSFDDIEANFAPEIKESGEYGVLYTAEPLDACDTLKNKVVEGLHSPFVLIIRGRCIFDDKVRAAQRAGFKAAIVYNNEDNSALVSMAGTSEGITIHAVFVTKSSGEVLKKYAERTDVELWIMPTFENSAWSIIAISLISLLAMSTVMATCFFVRRYRIRREVPRVTNVRELHGMSRRLVKSMPSLIFTSVLEDNCTSRMCAVCLEDYNIGEKIRVLPCRHKFHALCVDAWLTTWRTFCPVCKRDANTSTGTPPASESTPLLSSTHALSTSPSSAAGALSSFHSTPLLSSTQELSTSPSSVVGALSSFYSTPLLSSTHASSTSPSTLGKSSSFHSYLAASPSRAILVSPMLTHSSLTSHSAAAGALSSFCPSAVASSSRAIFISPMLPRSPLNSRTPSYLARLLAQVSAESLPGC